MTVASLTNGVVSDSVFFWAVWNLESALIRAIKSLNVYDLLRVAKKTLGENRSVVLESR